MKADPRLSDFLKVNDPLPEYLLSHLNEFLDHRLWLAGPGSGRSEAERSMFHLQYTTYAPLRSPIRRVPAEIIAAIIFWAIGGPGCFLDRKERAEFLRHRKVSKLWRQTAFSTPTLWRSLSIDAEGKQQADLVLYRAYTWFSRAGYGTEVHLAIKNWNFDLGATIAYAGLIWGHEEGQFQLTNLRISGIIGIEENLHPMRGLKTLSVTIDGSQSPYPRSPNLNIAFPSLQSLSFRMLVRTHATQIPHPIQHSNIRFLHLSGFRFTNGNLHPLTGEMPALEELVVFTYPWEAFEVEPVAPFVTNASIKRLVLNLYALAAWRRVNLSSLQHCKIINEDGRQLTREKNFVLVLASENLERFNSRSLTLDLTSLKPNYDQLGMLISRLSSLRSLRLHSLAPLFSEEPLKWRLHSIGNIVCQEYAQLPLCFTTSTTTVSSSSTNLLVYAANSRRDDVASSHYRCVSPDERFMGRIPFDLICLPGWQINDIIQNEFPMQHSDYDEILKWRSLGV
jgi:hypothetical protein